MAILEDVRNIFGLAITTAYIRTRVYNVLTTRLMCEAFAIGFGLDPTDGDNIFLYFRNQSQPDTSGACFFDTPYVTYEQSVSNILAAFLPSTTPADHLSLLTLAAHACIYAYALNSSIDINDFIIFLGKTLIAVADNVCGQSYFGTVKVGFPPVYFPVTPFTTDVLQTLLQNNYSSIITNIGNQPRNSDAPLTNYNWYDVSSLLHGPDLQVMKDIENQYYYISGQMVYESAYGTLDPCIEDITTISTATGNTTFTYVRNTPCRETDSYIGPVNYTQFKRIFNDGPSSSGHLTGNASPILGFYSGNDIKQLPKQDYLSNYCTLLNYTGQTALSTVFIEPNGAYDLLDGDYANAPYGDSSNTPLQRMHIGDNKPRYINNVLTTATGFKYASVELPNENWTLDLQFRQTNPLSDTRRMLKRVWSVSDNPYSATDVGGILYPYVQDPNPPFNQYWYVGYPQLNGTNSIPNLAFFQTFDSPTFGDSPSVAIYPSISTSLGSETESGNSVRSYQLSSMQLFSGAGNLPIKFKVSIGSNLSGRDPTAQKFFGMGTAFSGKYSISVTHEENAGFFYTGLSVSYQGQTININSITGNYQNSIIGKYKTAKYISGYQRVSDGYVFPLTNKIAVNGVGDNFTYSYIDQLGVDGVVSQDGWGWFAQVPSVLETDSFIRLYDSQTVESYFPRFYDGPFSIETRKFLYPNALAADKIYQGKINGIPTGVSFDIVVREEAVREIYGKYTIYQDGSESREPELVNVIRADTANGRLINPKMDTMFLPVDEGAKFDYDFNFWDKTQEFDNQAAIGELVDNNWAPMILGQYVPLGRNSNVYNAAATDTSRFNLGLRKTRQGVQKHVVRMPLGQETIIYSYNPNSDGLFHTFKYNALKCNLAYTLPIFSLEQNALIANDAMLSALPDSVSRQGLDGYSYDGHNTILEPGLDPLFFEFIGGRRGSSIAAAEGGYHSKGIIGDSWIGSTYNTYGSLKESCFETNLRYHNVRYPAQDDHLMVFNTSPTGTDIWINGFNFAPYRIDRNLTPIQIGDTIPYQTDNANGTIPLSYSGGFFNFNIQPYFPLRLKTGGFVQDEWYYKTGLLLGPFDKDIEVGISNGEVLAVYSDFYVNGKQTSHWFYNGASCDRDWAMQVCNDRFLRCGEPAFTLLPRNVGYSIIAVIPANTVGVFNIHSAPDDPTYSIIPSITDVSRNYIGMPSGCILSLRTHEPLDANDFEPLLQTGEQGRMESNFYINNSIPTKYTINHTLGIEGLIGVHEFQNYGYTGKLYPIPDTTAFQALASYDSNNNIIYGPNITPENYWKLYAIKNHTTVTFSGYREGSRVSFEITNLKLLYDKVPFQVYNLVAPSGTCILSGEMGYYAQADNTVFTEGFYLTNATPNDLLAQSYNPSYVSDVLKLIPSGLFQFPVVYSGSGQTAPVLQAPSVMKQRQNESGISPDQTYYYLFRSPSQNYNKLLWPALSDLETLNPGETMESIAPGDGNTFSNSTMIFSASQGQALPNGLANPKILKTYTVQNIFQTYDSVATVSSLNSGICITSGRGTSVSLNQSQMSGALVPVGTPLSLVIQGLF